MKGKLIHNLVMAATIEAAVELKGYPTFREFPIRPGRRPPSVDLACRANGHFIVFEFERTGDRVGNDAAKAEKIGADVLAIVVPNALVRQHVRGVLKRLDHRTCHRSLQIQVMTLGAALQWVANNCPTIRARVVTPDLVPATPPALTPTKGTSK